MSTVTAELVASVLSVSVTPGQRVEVGDELLLTDVVIKAGDTVRDGDPLVVIKR